MSILSDMAGKGKVVSMGGQEVKLQPLTVRELAKFADLQTTQDLTTSVEYLIKTTLTKALPDATVEEIDNLSPDIVLKLMTEILHLNKLAAPSDEKKKLVNPSQSENESS